MNILSHADVLVKLGFPAEDPDIALSQLTGSALEEYKASLSPSPEYYEIDADADLYLEVEGDGSAYRIELAEAFSAAWQRIPAVDRAKITSFRKGLLGTNTKWGPSIRVSTGLQQVAQYQKTDRIFEFNAEAVEEAVKDGRVVDLIGHELGHAWCHTRPNSHFNTKSIQCDEWEDEANACAQSRWGFDMTNLASWGSTKSWLFVKITKNLTYSKPFRRYP